MPAQPLTSLPALLGRGGEGICRAVKAARMYLRKSRVPELLGRVGQTIKSIPRAQSLDKRFFQASYRGDPSSVPDDLLTGRGPFYITEQRRLFLDCTAGHYQITWGYNHPELNATVREAMDLGIVWDDHSNIPGNPVKRLSARLVQVANDLKDSASQVIQSDNALNTVLLGVCTGSVAASSALKIVLKRHERVRPGITPVVVAISGNYHGTDFLAQRLRGMWQGYFRGVKAVQIEPNDVKGLRRTFRTYRGRVAAFFAEPILMNREAILLEEEFMREARTLCDEAEACMVLDEIQTGFWCPEVFMFLQYDIIPDILVIGKGMTAGFHSLAAIVYKRKYDCLEQYDAISTNGNAPLASTVALCCLALIERDRRRIENVSRHYVERLQEIPRVYPKRVAAIHGKGLLLGVKFHSVGDALTFHRRCIEHGLWVRVHAYHEGHSTVLTKLCLTVDKQIVDFIVDTFLHILGEMNDG